MPEVAVQSGAVQPVGPRQRAAGDVVYTRGRKIFLGVVFVVWFGVSALIVVTALRSTPPPPDPLAGPYTQKFPAIRLIIAAFLAAAAFGLWTVRARVLDTPVLELAGARPGRALYRGTVRAESPVFSSLTGSPCAWYRVTARRRGSRTIEKSEVATKVVDRCRRSGRRARAGSTLGCRLAPR